mmetsp:Transcript_4820/g.14305  ORF Transcript_4820/g.14305 Transcript_4820/m.14305 type:complete len:474 (-) Transcript_4820:150-1571(-)
MSAEDVIAYLRAQGHAPAADDAAAAFAKPRWAAPAAPAATPVASEQTASPMNVFVGKLPLEVHDSCVEALLTQCGPVLKWKRTMDSETGAAKAFGFCTFASAEGALQAVKLLNDFALEDQKILVKVGKKEQAVIDELVARKQRAARAAGATIGAPATAVAAATRTPADEEKLKKLQQFASSSNLRAPVDAALLKELGGGAAEPASAAPASREQMIAEEMEKFRASQAQRDKELEDERRRKLQAKIQETMRLEQSVKEGLESAEKRKPEANGAAPVKRARTEAPTETVAAPTGMTSGFAGGFSLKATGRGLGRGFTPTRPAAKVAAPAAGFAAVAEDKPRELITVDYGDDAAPARASPRAAPAASDDKKRDRAIAEAIPTDKHALFASDVDWAAVERHDVVRTKLRAWVAKKIEEYLGEPEATLIDFVCQCLARRANPEEIRSELALVLDEDAEVLVVKLWRVLLFHAAKAGQA